MPGSATTPTLESAALLRPESLCFPCQRLIGDISSGNICTNELWQVVEQGEARYSTFHHADTDELQECSNVLGCRLCQLLVSEGFEHATESPKEASKYYIVTADLFRSFEVRRIPDLGHIVQDGYFVLATDYADDELGEVRAQAKSSSKILIGPNDPELRFETVYKPDWPLTARKDTAGICRNVLTSPRSKRCLALARRWLATCQAQHIGCSRKELPQLPTRVIDIGSPSLNSRPRLYVTNGEGAPYVTLSYCWGGDVPSKTTSTKFHSYQDGLNISELPQTFRDAIFLTRELGFRYLWVDALCIIQDDLRDWEREAAEMGNIYSNSVFTISALSSHTSSEGFLGKRPPTSTKSVSVGSHRICEAEEFRDLSVRKIKRTHFDYCLSNRGWTLQERILPAALLHYTPEGMIWECRTHCVWEHGEGQPTIGMLKAMSYFTGIVDMDFLWQRVVHEYSYRALTVKGDKLPAIAGVAQYFKKTRPESDEYLAGIWKESIPESLRWIAVEGATVPQPSGYRAPSWSWAAVDGRVEWLMETSNETPVDDLGFQLLDAEVEDSPPGSMGRVISGQLEIYGVVRECFFDSEGQWSGKLRIDEDQICLCWTDRELGSGDCFALALGLWRFLAGGDFNHQNQLEEKYRAWYLVLERGVPEHQISGDTSEGEQDIFQESLFKRLGIAYHDFEVLPSLHEFEQTLLRVI